MASASQGQTTEMKKQSVECAVSASPNRTLAMVIFLVLIGISGSCLLSPYFTAWQPFPRHVFLYLTIGYEAAAIVCLVLMMRFADDRPAYGTDADADLQPWHKLVRHNIKLFGIVLFYCAIFVFNIFRLVADSQCADAWNACADDEVRIEHEAGLVYTLISTVYLFVVLIFCVRFNAKVFQQTMLVLAGLAVIQAANVSGWLNALVDESDVFLLKPNSTGELQHCFNDTVNNQSNHTVQCFTGTTGVYKLLHDLNPYLFPFIMEYLMLVTECVLNWFFSGADNYATLLAPTQSEEPRTTTTNPATSDGNTRLVEPPEDEDIDPARQASSPPESTLDETTPLIGTPSSSSTFRRWWFILVNVLLSLIANFLLMIFDIFSFCCGDDGTAYLYIFPYFQCGYWLLLCLTALVGYAASHSLDRSRSTSPTSFEYFMLLSSVGLIIQSILTIVNRQMSDGEESVKKAVIVAEITHVVHICVQVTFYTYAKRIRPPTTDDGVDERGVESRRRKLDVLTGVISYYIVCNFALWVEGSFVETRTAYNSSEKQYFEDWPLVYNILNPLSLLFRFNSALLFLVALLDKRRC